MKTLVPYSEGHLFTTVEGRVELMRKYGGDCWPYSGANEDGEQVMVSITTEEIVVKTYQKNGWIRVNYYGVDGYPEGETFEGRWDMPKNVNVSTEGTSPDTNQKPTKEELLKEHVTRQQVVNIVESIKNNYDLTEDDYGSNLLSEVVSLLMDESSLEGKE